MMRETFSSRSAETAMAIARYVLPVPAGPIPKVTSCARMACTYLRWPVVLGVTLGLRVEVLMRSAYKSRRASTPSPWITVKACVKSRDRMVPPVRNVLSSNWNRFLARSIFSAVPSSLIQPSREVAFTPSTFSSESRLRGSLANNCCATRAFSKCNVSVAILLVLCQGRAQFCGGFFQSFRNHARLRNGRHKIHVTCPARHHMDVQVLLNARARHAAQIHADIEPVWLHRLRQRLFTAPHERHQLEQFVFGQIIEIWNLAVRQDHEMPAVIRMVIQHREAGLPARDHIIGLIVIRLGNAGENGAAARERFRPEDVLDAPRRVQGFHAAGS